jgi:hypothetical protein
MKSLCVCFFVAGAIWLSGCAVTPKPGTDSTQTEPANAWLAHPVTQAVQNLHAPEAWKHLNFPGKQPSTYAYSRKDGRDALSAHAQASASMFRLPVRVEPADLAGLRFSWQVPQLIDLADMAQRDADDAPVRVVLAFDGDRTQFSTKNALLSELSRAITGEELPYATLMYVWCNKRPVESIITNARTDRVRKLVVQHGPDQLNQWLDYERNIKADFERVFGEPPGALVGIAIMTDADNTRSQARAWYGTLSLTANRKPEMLLKK